MEYNFVQKIFILALILSVSELCYCTSNTLTNEQRQLNPLWQSIPSVLKHEITFEELPNDFQLFQQHSRPLPKLYERDDSRSESTMEEYDSEAETDSNLPYGIQNANDIRFPIEAYAMRSTRSRANPNPAPKVTFQSLCPVKREKIDLLFDPDYEYRPSEYEEIHCAHPYTNQRDYKLHNNKVCGETGFSCIQLNRTIYLTRRLRSGNCWESKSITVPAGCECMWPRHHLGDILSRH